MSDTLEVISIVLLMASSLVVFVTALGRLYAPPRFVIERRVRRARAKLRTELRTIPANANETRLYWDRYRELGKLEILAAAEEFGWLHTDQRIVDEGWELHFVSAHRHPAR